MAFRREKHVPHGGPAGGDGGDGGAVALVGDKDLNTLYHLRFRSQLRAERGRHGEGSNKTGRRGQDLRVTVPLGTQAFDVETGELMGEVLADGEELIVAEGGGGGRGNARFATSTNRAPRRFEQGRPGAEHRLRLELKLLADAGVVGLPNAGKSTLISTISAARPKIAEYPFTTLVPQLGVVARDLDFEPFVVADLPGLIRGAAQGAGLGTRFLKHVERCRVLIHLVDLSDQASEAEDDLVAIEQELEAFRSDLLERPRILVGSKLDVALAERREKLAELASRRRLPHVEISSITGEGVDQLVNQLAELLAATEDSV